MEPLSVFITTYNNEHTLPACLESVKWADEVLILDSHSTDRTIEIARAHGCVVHQHPFQGFGRQKQRALDLTRHERVLFLDADEALSPELAAAIQTLQREGFDADGYELPRQEQIFWRMADRRTRMNYYLRLLRRSRARFTEMPVHAAAEINGEVKRIHHPFLHFGEPNIHTKVEKVNMYSTGLVADKVARNRHPSPLIMILYPPLFFIRGYIFKRGFVNGWAGFISAIVGAFYVFLKYAKLFEHFEFEKHGGRFMPPEAPPLRAPKEYFDGPV